MGTKTPATKTLPPIKGVAYPRFHEQWCDQHGHYLNWSDIVENDYDDDPPPCRLYVTGGFLPEVRRCTDPELPPTRERQESWGITIERVTHVLEDGREIVDDSVIVLGKGLADEDVFRLLPGEARTLAAALIRASDIEMYRGVAS